MFVRWDLKERTFSINKIENASTSVTFCKRAPAVLSMREAIEIDLAELDTLMQSKSSKLCRTSDVHKVLTSPLVEAIILYY